MDRPPDHTFSGATITGIPEQDNGFDAGQYSFFGNLDDAALDDELGGGLEDGVDAPPEEELPAQELEDLPLEQELQDDDTSDLSFASMFAAGVGLDDRVRAGQLASAPVALSPAVGRASSSHAGRESPICSRGPLYGLASPVASTLPGKAQMLFNVGPDSLSQLQQDSAPVGPSADSLPAPSFSGAGLPYTRPAGTPYDAPQQAYGGAGLAGARLPPPGFGPQRGRQEPHMDAALLDPAVLAVRRAPPSPSPPMPSNPGMAKVMTAEELEQQLLSAAESSQQPAPQQQQQAAQQYGTPSSQYGGPPQQQLKGPPLLQPPPGHPYYRPMLPGMPPGPPPGGLPPYGPRPGMPPPQRPPGAQFPAGMGPRPQLPGPFPPGFPQFPNAGMPQHMPSGLRPGMRSMPPPGYTPPGYLPPPSAQFPGNPPRPLPPFDMPPPFMRGMHMQQPGMGPRGPDSIAHYMGRGRNASKYMSHEEVEAILRIQWRSLHSQGSLYLEDYYYQAFVYRHHNRRNARAFAPDHIRDLAPAERAAPGAVAYVKLEGLGKITFSNIRRPRPLMDVDVSQGKGKEGGGEAAAESGSEAARVVRPLEQEPLLAARIMVEDCYALMLDVDDVDRLLSVGASAGGGEVDGALVKRRQLLMEGLAASLRLPDAPALPPANGGAKPAPSGDDGVFLRLLALKKGGRLLARALRTIYPPPDVRGAGEPNLRILWALLRNAWHVFGAVGVGGAAGEEVEVVSGVADAGAAACGRLHSGGNVVACMEALVEGDLANVAAAGGESGALLPLLAPGDGVPADPSRPWLADVIASLLRSADGAGLSDSGAAPSFKDAAAGAQHGAQRAAWRAAWRLLMDRLFAMLSGHLAFVSSVFAQAQAAGAGEVLDTVRLLVPVEVVRSAMPHLSDGQQAQLRATLAALTA